MFNSTKPWLIVLTFCFVSIGLNLGMYLYYDPKSLHENLSDKLLTEDVYFFWNYCQMPIRMSPYLFGMYAAQMYHQNKSFDSITLDWMSFIGVSFASTIGSVPMFDGEYLGYKANLVAVLFMRPLLGLSWAF